MNWCLQQAVKLPQSKKPPKYHTAMSGQNVSCLLKKEETQPMGQSSWVYGSNSNKSRLTSLDLNSKAERISDLQNPWTT